MTDKVAVKVEQFFSQHRTREYLKGQVLLLAGDNADYIFQIVEGRVKEYDVTYRGEEIILNIFKSPAFFPMSLAMNKTPSNYIFAAETDVVIRQVPKEDVLKFLQENSDVMFDLLSRVYKGVDGLMGRMVQLMSGSARDRIAYEIILETKRFGDAKTGDRFELGIHEKELGARAGLTRETVNREIHKLKKEKIVDVIASGLVVLDLPALLTQLGQFD